MEDKPRINRTLDEALKLKQADQFIDPVRMTRDSKFRFRCHPGVPCFTKCCRNMNIILTPYDIIRLKNRLGLNSDMFLKLYAQPELLSLTGLPVARLKMLEERDGQCPFVTPEGCQVYTDRPVCCRYYPIGLASLKQQDKRGGEEDEFFFMITEDHCKGFEEDTEWTVASWREDQESDFYDRMNRDWMELLLRKKSFGEETEIPEKGRRMFYMASTNMEQFRSFIFESRFLEKYDVKEKVLREVMDDEVRLMQFSFEFMKVAIFSSESDIIKLKKKVLDKTVKKILQRRKKQMRKAQRLRSGRR
jgi:Fe-S-cluster containining protein